MAPFFSFASFGGGIASKLLGGASIVEATGGTELTPGDGFKYHVFIEPGTLTVSSSGEVTYLIVGGGGGAGSGGSKQSPSSSYDQNVNYGGGGGAGGVLTGITELSSSSYPITVGSGGSGGTVFKTPPSHPYYNKAYQGSDGGPSTFNSLTAVGGGGGGATPGRPTNPGIPDTDANGRSGGSGGGGGATYRPGPSIYHGTGGSGTPGQGNPGRTDESAGPPFYQSGAGGGGGAGGPSPSWKTGGPALACPEFPAPAISPAIPADPQATNWATDVGPTGRFGAGGPGGGSTIPAGWTPRSNGTDYTGMGGRGRQPGPSGGNVAYPGYDGGNGIVIIKYPA